MKICVSTALYYKKNYIEVLDILAAAGVKNIELALNQTFIDVPLEDIKRALDQRQMKVHSIHLPLTFIAYDRGEDEGYWLDRGLTYLNALGGRILVSHFFYKPGIKEEANPDHFSNMVAYNKTTSYDICTENLPSMPLKTLHQDHQGLRVFLEENACPMTFDTTHVGTHGLDLMDQYFHFKDYIRNIHLSDFKDGREHLLLGQGDLDLKTFIGQLKADGYDHPLTLEFDFENPSRAKISDNSEAIEAIKSSLQFVEDAMGDNI